MIVGVMDSPFSKPTSPRLPDIVTDGAIHLLGTVGVDQFSIRRLAKWMGVTPSRLLDVFTRARLVEIIVITFSDRWLEWAAATHDMDAPLRLPVTPDERLGVRTRTALEQLAEAERLRGNRDPSRQFEFLDSQERMLLGARLARLSPPCCRPDDDEIRAAMALLAGLRSGLAAEPPRLTLSLAGGVMTQFATAITIHRTDCDGEAMAS